MFGDQTAAGTKIPRAALFPVPFLRPFRRLHSKICALPYLFPGDGLRGDHPRRKEIKLVGKRRAWQALTLLQIF